MPGKLANLRLNVKIALLGAGSALAAVVVLVILAFGLSVEYNALAQAEVSQLIDQGLDYVTRGVGNLVSTENEAVGQQVRYNLNVLRHTFEAQGRLSFSPREETWTVTNQATGESREIRLRELLLGGRPLGKNADPAQRSPVVDEVSDLVGETATIFQRMDAAGNMLRVATTVLASDGKRAIGTYIPAREPDGSPNPVVERILAGKGYLGRAYVVNAWYLTAYEPVKDPGGEVVGMLYVGVKQSIAEARIRQSVIGMRIGRTGYAYVITGKGENRGHYVISENGLRDGEDIWNVQDSDGNYVIRKIVSTAVSLRSGEMATIRYRWQNTGEPEPRWKIARIAYFEPWDWVIGASVYEDELRMHRAILVNGRRRMMTLMIMSGAAAAVLLGFLGMSIAGTIARPLSRITEAAKVMAQGNYGSLADIGSSSEEIAVLAKTFNLMSEKVRLSLEGLRASEEKYRSIYENAVEGIFQTSLDGRLLNANPATARILGYASPEEAVADLMDIRTKLYVRSGDRDEFVAELRERGFVLGKELLYHKKGDGVIWVALNARLARGPAGEPLYIEGFVIDISDRKQASEELERSRERLEELVRERTSELTAAKEAAEEANKAKSRFIAAMSHELRTPLNAIMGYAQILMRRPLGLEAHDGMSIIRQSGEHLLTLINDILDLAKIEAGKLELQPAPIGLQEFLSGIMAIIRSRGESKGLQCAFRAKGDLPPAVLADETRLRQVLLNLLGNAVKFTDKGQVVLRVGPAGEDRPALRESGLAAIRFEIEDTGQGLRPDQLGRLFQPFEQVGDDASRHEGTGLGLAISRQLVRLMGRDLDVSSEPGKGSVFGFELSLPVVEALPEAPAAEADRIIGYDGPRRRILVVDDIASNRAIVTGLLAPLGFEIEEVEDGGRAIAAIKARRPDLVLMDRWMPSMDGFAAVKAVRELPGFPDLPILALSASVSSEDRQKSLEAGFDDFLAKPLQWSKLAAALGERLGLTWIHAEAPSGRHGAGADLAPPSASGLPGLLDLARKGDLAALVEMVGRMAEGDARYGPFADRLRALAKGFKVRDIIAFIEAYLPADGAEEAENGQG